MARTEEGQPRILLLLCMVLLALQFCFPLALQASTFNPTVDVVSFVTKDPEAPSGKPVVPHDIDLPTLRISAFFSAQGLDVLVSARVDDDDREGIAFLPSTGLQPSAP